jgi:phage-related protein
MKGTKHKIGEFKVNITNGWFRVFFWPYGRVLWLVLAYVKKDNKTDRNKLDTCDDIIDDLRERLGVS